jgi:hypothetical protein
VKVQEGKFKHVTVGCANLIALAEKGAIINAGACVDEKLTFKLNGEICCSKDWFKAAKSNSEIYTIILFWL